MNTKDKGITLVALVITVIILLILAGITISTLLGENGLITKAQKAASDYKQSEEIENSDLESINAIIEGIWSIGNNNPLGGGDTPSDIDIGLSKAMSYSSNSITTVSNKYLYIEDFSGNENYATPINPTVTDNGKGLICNDSSGYGSINKGSSLTFPLTLESSFSCDSLGDSIIYYDGYTNTSISFYSNYVVATIGTNTTCIDIPSEFTNSEIKHIAITFNTLTDFNVYFNGVLYTQGSNLDSWGDTDEMYLCSKPGGTYKFNGTLYTLRVYNKKLTQDEISTSYTSDLNMITNNSNNISRNNLFLEYVIKDNYYQVPTTIADQSGNNNNITCHNIIYDRFSKGLIFIGDNNCYGDIDYKDNVTFPLSIDLTFSCNNSKYCSIYFDYNTKTAIGVYGNYLITSIGTDVNTLQLSDEFFDNSTKHLVVVYNSVNDFKVYLNGVEQELTGSADSWGDGGCSPYDCFVGKRTGGMSSVPFKGTIYELNVFNGATSAEQVTTLYNNSVAKYPR